MRSSIMTLKKNADKIRQILSTAYPDVKTQLDYKTPFQLLVATILSAQCTDKQVNQVTPVLFLQLSSPQDFAEADIETIEKLIRSTGFYHNKARNIRRCSEMLVSRFHGRVPDTMAELIQLAGVGRKTANVVLGAAFGKPGIVVDTHVARISRRLGLTRNQNPEKIEDRSYGAHSQKIVECVLSAPDLFWQRDLQGQKARMPVMPAPAPVPICRQNRRCLKKETDLPKMRKRWTLNILHHDSDWKKTIFMMYWRFLSRQRLLTS